jgi:FtsZ-binding cell division protein ZapB
MSAPERLVVDHFGGLVVRRKLSLFQKALRDHEESPYVPPSDDALYSPTSEKSADLDAMSVDELKAELQASRQREQEAREIAQAAAQEQASLRNERSETLASRLRVLQKPKHHWR